MTDLTPAQQAAITEVIEAQEGGWVLSKDADGGDGGWTFGGVTAKTWNSYKAEMKLNQMPELGFDYIQARNFFIDGQTSMWLLAIYKDRYIMPWMLQLSDKLFAVCFSAAINEGEHSAELVFQKALNRWIEFEVSAVSKQIKEDGDIGAITMAAFNSEFNNRPGLEDFINLDFLYCWMQSYIAICRSNPVKLQFLEGWHNRVEYWRTA